MKQTFILVSMAGLALTALTACGAREEVSLDGLQLPVAQSRSTEPADGSGGAAANQAAAIRQETQAARIAEPTVVKTQKWVKIFSGPSVTDIKPNSDKRQGSRTVELNAVENDQIGTFVTDGAGRTLYRFDNDTNKPPKSTCNGDCAIAWPPLLIKSPGRIFPKGIDPKILGYVERADHHCQVTINGWPVYYFVGDVKPGDINGQGVNGKWFGVAPDGSATKPLPGPLASAGN